MARTDYYKNANAPKPNSIVPAVSAIVVNDSREILVHRRVDNDLWALPGGGIEFGESASSAIIREVREETGLIVTPVHVIAVYSDPEHVFSYSNGEVRQEFSICILCEIQGGELAVSDESKEVRFATMTEVDTFDMHPRIRARIDDYRNGVVAGLNP